ncbi:MAG: hypothetical protein Q7S78_01925 [Candidatus Azambacteria bacterium]|nr:hypothetical protein [Candidatus Azambacteria bacterium]
MLSPKQTNLNPHKSSATHRIILLLSALLLSACASKPPPPDWQANAFSALKGFSAAYLSGNSRLADFEFARAKSEIASTGRADFLARAELTRCAVRVASLEFDDCAAYQTLARDAQPAEQAYATYLSGRWTGLDPALLPAPHRALVLKAAASEAKKGPANAAPTPAMLDTFEDPLARLVAAGVLLQNSRLSPADMATATETASAQGWRRPLLAWLGVQLKRATDGGDLDAAARLQRRIDVVLQLPAKTQ